ncbi:DNA polymerase I [Verrucomicrobiota bacterium]
MKKKLFLLDGMALIYRAYFGFIRNPMINSNGIETSGVFGFMNTLLEIIDKQEPTHLAMALDVSGPTFRHEMFEEYKAHRDETPDGIRTAVPIIREIMEAMNIPVISKQGYEADDIIGTLARQAEKEGFDTYMVTGDKDYAQLVDEHTFFYKPGSKGSGVTILDEAAILEEWEIERIDQVIDILGLAGDTADNIPGVPGVGPKTAKKLIAQFGSIENLLENTDQLKGKQKEKVEANKTTALLCKKLVTIHCDVPIDEKPADLERKEADNEKLKALLQQYELNAILKRLFGNSAAPAPQKTVKKKTGPIQGDLFAFAEEPQIEEKPAAPAFKTIKDVKHKYTLIESLDKIDGVVETLKNEPAFCFDTETTSLDPKEAELVGISFAVKEHEAWYIHFPGDDTKERLAKLQPLFKNAKQAKIGHNLKYDISVLKWQGVEVRGQLLDTMLAHYLVDPDQRHNMDHLAETELGYRTVHITELIGEKKGQQISMRDVPLKKVTEYAAEDADITLQLWNKLEPQLKEHNLEKVFYEIESPLVHVLSEMESTGVMLNVATLENYSVALGNQIAELEKEIFTMSGAEFNLNSPKQLGEILFDVLKLVEKPKKTKTGQYATSEQVLTELAAEHDIVQKVLDYRGLTKLKSTYVDALPNSISPKTGRIHTNFAQAVTTTGRLSSTDPNLQNIPIRTPEGQEIRRAFTAPISGNGNVRILACDYSQVELRLMAELSGDKNMRKAFIHGEDIHTATAARVYGVELNEVTKDMRRKAKMVNFGIIYGISAFGLAQRLKIPRKEAAEMIEQYFKQYPGVKKYMDDTIQFARDNGYVETVTGRRRYTRDINVKNNTVRQAAERNAINAPLQGTAADMIKIAMINIHQMLKEWHTKTRMVLQVHDELIFELHMDEADELVPKIENLMRTAIPMEIPLLVESGTGENWLEAH